VPAVEKPLLSSPRFLLIAVVGLSLVLRLALVAQGGQYYFGDEERYDRGVRLYLALRDGDPAGVREIAALPEHALFPWIGAAVTAGQHGLAQFTRYGDWSHPENVVFTMWLGAALLSLFSTLNLFLLHRLARTAGASDAEAGWALLLMAASNTAFYYARHLLPYECALSAALAAMIAGLGRPTPGRAFACGLLGGIAYGIYNGYWYLVPVIWLVHLLACRGDPRHLRLTAICAAGAMLALALPVVVGASLGGANYWAMLRAFGHSPTLGLFSEGWSLPWEYFFHSEGAFGVAVAGCIVLALLSAWRARAPLARWVRGTLVALAAAYALLILFSLGLGRFVVYARTVKPLVPLLALLGGWALARLLAGRPRLRPVALAGLVLAAAVNFWPHFPRVFPRDVEIAVLRNWGNPKRTLSVAGSLYVPLGGPVTRPALALVNAQLLYPVRSYVGFPAGKTLLQIAHPLSYAPFQYECHTPRERALLRREDISIRLIQLADPAALSDNPPLSMLYLQEDRPTGR
jgi:hypothetical protein